MNPWEEDDQEDAYRDENAFVDNVLYLEQTALPQVVARDEQQSAEGEVHHNNDLPVSKPWSIDKQKGEDGSSDKEEHGVEEDDLGLVGEAKSIPQSLLFGALILYLSLYLLCLRHIEEGLSLNEVTELAYPS